jgi:orotidine-5'-phosphate decarboxylase
MNYADRLEAAIQRTGNSCVIGLDPHPALMPDDYAVCRDASASRAKRAQATERFLVEVIGLIAGRVPAVKPQSAFFELLGADGVAAWERVVAAARAADLLVIGDVKRGDIASTARAYADAFLACEEEFRCDAVTINPYLGADSVEPFLEVCAEQGAGVYVLVRTSNPGSGMFQELGDPRLVDQVATEVARWGEGLLGECGLSSVGAVVGATHTEELTHLRERMPRTPFLIPGYGAQGAGAKEIAPGFLPGGRGALVNSSRGILYAHRNAAHAGKSWHDATTTALDAMIAELKAAAAGC